MCTSEKTTDCEDLIIQGRRMMMIIIIEWSSLTRSNRSNSKATKLIWLTVYKQKTVGRTISAMLTTAVVVVVVVFILFYSRKTFTLICQYSCVCLERRREEREKKIKKHQSSIGKVEEHAFGNFRLTIHINTCHISKKNFNKLKMNMDGQDFFA